MKAIRALAAGIVVLLGAYFALRAAASGCSGSGCDAYIPISLLVPLLILVTAAINGVVATSHARGSSAWFGMLLAVTVVGFLGPLVTLLVFRNNPDYFVAVSSLLELLVAIATLSYSFVGQRSKGGAA